MTWRPGAPFDVRARRLSYGREPDRMIVIVAGRKIPAAATASAAQSSS